MKKFISILISFVMILTLAMSVAADYRGTVDGLKMSPGINPVVKLRENNRFDYVIYARDMDGMTNGDFTLYYDTSCLKIVGIKMLAPFDGAFVNDMGGEVYFSFLYHDSNEDDALKMYVLTFEYTRPGIYPSIKVTNMAGTFLKSVADVQVIDGKDADSDHEFVEVTTVETTTVEITTSEVISEDVSENNSAENSKGDVNGDGKISASDARLALRVAAGLVAVSSEEFARADMNSDGNIFASEARIILRIAAGLE